MSRILIVDDDPSVLSAFERVLAEHDHDVTTLASGSAALSLLEHDRPDLLIMDIRMPGLSGLETFDRVHRLHPRLPVIMMTGYATMETAVEATKLGAFDYHIKPLDPEEMMQSIEAALQSVRLMQGQVRLEPESAAPGEEAMVGGSRAMQEVYKAIGRVAATNATVLIRGETGTGKELVARAIYQHSTYRDRPLIVLNCAAIPESLIESELFGHEGGAFTGAQGKRIGKIEQANGGTLFLDEVGDMPPASQVKLLRVLQERNFERVGGNQTVHVDIRVIAATHRPLEEAVSQSRFRADLLHRLNVFAIHVPPLRERLEDMDRLVAYFLDRFSRELGIERPVISDDARAMLERHSWPGNVRELEHCLHRAMIVRRGYPIQAEDIRQSLVSTRPMDGSPASADSLAPVVTAYLRSHSGDSTHSNFIDKLETLLITETLRITRGNQTHAARWLGLSRPTLKAKMDRLGIPPGPPPATQ